MPWCSPARPANCADITHVRQSGLVKLLAHGPAVEILADAGYQSLGAQTGGRVMTPPPHRNKTGGAGRRGRPPRGKVLEDVEQATGVGSGPVETRA